MKTAIVTGGSRGIGASIVNTLAKNGYNVYFCYSNSKDKLDEIDTTLPVFPTCADVSNESSVISFVQSVISKTGSIDLAVCNAGISNWGLFTDITEEEWDHIFNVNTKGVFFTSKHVSKEMIKNHSGSIITISSIWGQIGASCEAAYSASKAAVIGFTKSIAKELAPSGITVNCICPGVINTSMNSRFSKEEMEDIISEIPIGEIGQPEDIANTVLFLANSKFITGQVISQNGGQYI